MTTFDQGDDRHEPVEVICSDEMLSVRLRDGRSVSAPLWWYPRLHGATPAERTRYELMPLGVHWPEIDEDISVRGLILGNKAPEARAPELREPESTR